MGLMAGNAVVLKVAAATLTPASLELDGNNPMMALADADLERATTGAARGG